MHRTTLTAPPPRKSRHPARRGGRWSCVVLFIIGALALAACGGDEPAATDEPADDQTETSPPETQPEAQSRLELAQEEGRLVWYSGLESTLAERIAAGFEEETGIAVDAVRLGGEQILTRVLQEAEVGVNLADVVSTGSEAHFVAFKDADLLVEFESAHDEHFADGFRDPDGLYYVPYILRFGIAYNTEAVAESDVPETWKDIADPKWEGMTTTSHPAFSVGAATVPYFWSTIYGYEFFDEVAATEPQVFQSLHDVIGLVNSGEAPIALLMADFIVVNHAEEGSPVAMVYPSDGVPAVGAGTAILKGAQNPNAAEEFQDYLLSQEGQQFIADDNRTAIRDDVTYSDHYVPVSEIEDLIVLIDPAEFEAELETVRKEFESRFGV